MSQQGSYTLQQIAFAFSQVAGAGDSVTSDFARAIREKFEALTSNFQQYLGTGWSLPWGPVVYSAPAKATGGDSNPPATNLNAADNAMLVVAGTDGNGNPVTIVSVAGTNPKSVLDRKEDLDVRKVVPFTDTTQIDQGTSIGLAHLEAMTSKGQTLQQYLESVASTSATLIFTGHSLGGALSPALALDLFVNKRMDLACWRAVYVTPSAGPTPGDAAFVSLFAKTFPAGGGWNLNVVNSLDCVPRAWNNLSSIATVYEPNLGPTADINRLVALFEDLLGKEKQFYAALPSWAFFGTYNPNALPPPPPPNNGDPSSLSDPTVLFAAQALYQHIPAYVEQLTPELAPFFSAPSLTTSDCEKLVQRFSPVAAA
jgi:hypothetical protein